MINKNEIQKIFNKLPVDKVELEKVQLGVVDDLGKLISKLEKAVAAEKGYYQAVKESNKIEKEAMKLADKASIRREKLWEKGDKLQKENEVLQDQVFSLLTKAETAAKELGVKPDTIPNFKKADSLIGKIAEIDPRSDLITNNMF